MLSFNFLVAPITFQAVTGHHNSNMIACGSIKESRPRLEGAIEQCLMCKMRRSLVKVG